MKVLTHAKSAALAEWEGKHRATSRPFAEKEERPGKDRSPTPPARKENTPPRSIRQ
jgi:hypothetical protein